MLSWDEQTLKELKDKNYQELAWSIMHQTSEFVFLGAFDLAFGEYKLC